MELRQMRVLLVVAEARSFTQAAEKLFLAQSAVSAAVRGLERELGVVLVDRSVSPIGLTEAGRVFVEHARATLAAADAATAAVQEYEGVLSGVVRLGILPTRHLPGTSVAAIVGRFMAEHPRVTVTASHIGGSPRQVEAVRDGTMDLAFVSIPSGVARGVELIPLAREPVQLLCNRTHPLVGRPPVGLASLTEEVFVEFPAGWGAPAVVASALAALDVELDVRYRVDDLNALVDFVTQDLAVALLPGSHVPPDPDLCVVALDDPPDYVVQLALPTNRRLSPAVRAFGGSVVATFRRPGYHQP